MLQEEVINLRIKVLQLELQKSEDEEIKSSLTGQLLVLRRRIFDSKQEKKNKLKDLKKKKRKRKLISCTTKMRIKMACKILKIRI